MSSTVSFGNIDLDRVERQLRVHGKVVAIGARAFDLLVALVDRRDRLVTKDELLDLAWPGLVVEENNLSVQISTLRKLLGPNAIVTLPGRGYRFVLPHADEPADGPAASRLPPAADQRVVRRLVAIACARPAGQTPSPAAWRVLRTTLVEPGVPEFGGRIIEMSAGGLWVEFASAVEALRWAVDLQQRLAADPATAPLTLRVGIGVEDLVVDDDRLVGGGVQSTASLAEAGSGDAIVVSEAVRAFAERCLPLGFRPLGTLAARRAGEEPVVAYAVEPLANGAGASAGHLAGMPRTPLAAPAHRPSVAVLPFATDSAADAYFGDGMTEEIISALSANRGLFVIARNSTLRYRGGLSAPAEIAAELRVRYLVVGSVRRFERRLRISAELVDAPVNRILCAERFDGSDDDLFEFQARIATSIAAAIDPRVQEVEIAQAVARPTESLSAYDCLLRGLAVMHTFRLGDFEAAGALLQRAIALDPNYARAHAQLAWWHNLKVGEGRSVEHGEDARMALALSSRALELDPRDTLALSVAGHIEAFMRKDFKAAMEMYEQALAINPSSALAWGRSATTLAYMGDGEGAIERARHAMRLSPYDPFSFAFYTTLGTACLVVRRDDEAVAWLHKARRLNPGYRAALRLLTAALALAGEREEASALAAEFMQQHEPTFSVKSFGSWYPLQEPHLSRLLEGLRLAGLPD